MELTLTRKILTLQSRPHLKRHVRLQFDTIRQAWALLGPEKVFWPDDVSLSILNLCNGTHTVSEIITQLAASFDAAEDDIRPDVEEFLQEWSDRSLVSL